MWSAFILLVLLGLLAYAWLVFPALLAWRTRGIASHPPAPPAKPLSVAVLLSAYREEAHIAERVRNLVGTTSELGTMTFHIGVDGPGDRTAGLATEAAGGDPRVHVHAFGEQRGKVAVIRDLVAATESDVILLTDANTFFHAGAVDALLQYFGDPLVGGVCGRLVLRAAVDGEGAVETDTKTEEGFYWQWETRLKRQESALDSCLGANGAIFALRRACFWQELPVNTVVDDLVIGLKVREAGFRMLYEPAAIAEEELPDVAHEWTRRVRIGSGDFQALLFCRNCLGPRYGTFAWMLWSHKVLRWFSPHIGILVAVMCVPAALSPIPAVALLGMTCGFALLVAAAMALLGFAMRHSGRQFARLPALFLHFVMMQFALLAGSVRFCTGKLEGSWRRTPRQAELQGRGR